MPAGERFARDAAEFGQIRPVGIVARSVSRDGAGPARTLDRNEPRASSWPHAGAVAGPMAFVLCPAGRLSHGEGRVKRFLASGFWRRCRRPSRRFPRTPRILPAKSGLSLCAWRAATRERTESSVCCHRTGPLFRKAPGAGAPVGRRHPGYGGCSSVGVCIRMNDGSFGTGIISSGFSTGVGSGLSLPGSMT